MTRDGSACVITIKRAKWSAMVIRKTVYCTRKELFWFKIRIDIETCKVKRNR